MRRAGLQPISQKCLSYCASAICKFSFHSHKNAAWDRSRQGYAFPGNVKIKMITTAEYRAWAEESLKWAGEARTANERDAYIKIAEVWLQSALRSERLSEELIPTADRDWVLPPFQEWRRKTPPKWESVSIIFDSAAKLLSKDEARRIAANIAKLPELLAQIKSPDSCEFCQG
jgi:hypothetical protein